jgi:NAD(P)-dependent dehydrogenase (short-subunit alcohol dehydrogenase family)
MVLALDLRQPESAKTVVEGTVERFGRIDALLNIAGAVPQIDLFQMTDAVNSVSPGAVMTGRRQSYLEKWAPAHNLTVEEAIKKFPEQAGITRFGRPDEIADLMSYLVSPAAKWMTGASVRMDGGEIKTI